MTEGTALAGKCPPWIVQQTRQLLTQRGHAWLLHGPSGLGQHALAMELARAWLCENCGEEGACGQCSSCHAVDVRTHADMCVLMPETVMLARGWPLSEKAQAEIDDKKRKASREIRVDAMRDAVEFSQRTSARGRGKVVLVYPAEQMNTVTANALLKTLEEPPGDVKFVLASESAHQLLPTIRSRCLGHTMGWPDRSASLAWMAQHGVTQDQATMLLDASGGRTDDALDRLRNGRDADQWRRFPIAMLRGDATFFKDWSASDMVDALQMLCHDMMVLQAGATPRFFPTNDLPKRSSMGSLGIWSKALAQSRRTMDHPFNAGLMQEALVAQAQSALNSRH